VEAGEEVEDAAVDAGGEGEGEGAPFDGLAVEEVEAHEYGEKPEETEAPEVFFVEKAFGDVDDEATGDEDGCVDEGFAEFEAVEAGGEPVWGVGFEDNVADEEAEEDDAFRKEEDDEAEHAVVFFSFVV